MNARDFELLLTIAEWLIKRGHYMTASEALDEARDSGMLAVDRAGYNALRARITAVADRPMT